MSQSRIKVKFANTLASAPMAESEVAPGTTVEQFLATQGGVPDNATIRVNRVEADLSSPLKEGDILSVVPKQIKGA